MQPYPVIFHEHLKHEYDALCTYIQKKKVKLKVQTPHRSSADADTDKKRNNTNPVSGLGLKNEAQYCCIKNSGKRVKLKECSHKKP